MSLLQLLGQLERVEIAMSGLYAWMSECFAADEEAAGFFYKLSIEERSHANLLRYGRKMVTRAPSDFGEPAIDHGAADALLETIESFASDRPQPTLAEALEFAIGLEQHPLENVHRAVLVAANPGVEAVVSSLANADGEHYRSLVGFAARRGVTDRHL